MSKKKILAVEDHDLLLLAIREILKTEGYEVITATDGVEALEKMQTFTPDLIVADISMPRMDGYTFFARVREQPEWVPIPFIFLTARAEREDRLKGKALGAEDYIVKPFDPDELVVIVRARIGRAEAIREVASSEFEDIKQRIVTLLSHELRTPLTSVYGYTELALEEAAGLPHNDFTNFLQGIKKGADRLTRLVEDLLMVVRIETAELEREFNMLGKVNSNLGPLITRTVKSQILFANEHDLFLEVEIQPPLPPVRVHELFLSDALVRLVDNAIKFTREPGRTITITARGSDGEKRAGDTGQRLEISVADEGVGIPPEKLRHLFHRFQQINRDRMEQQGAGLGLYIAQAEVGCMGGEITAQSTPDQGSTFTISLPAVQTATKSRGQTVNLPAAHRVQSKDQPVGHV